MIVALLIASPIRLRNLTMMAIGRHLSRRSEAWHLRLAAGETKKRQSLHLIVPNTLTPFVDHYLGHVRPAFPGASTLAHVWAAAMSKPMAYATIHARVLVTTKRLLGTALDPHALRTIAATLLTEMWPEDALHARSLLGHRKPTISEQQ